jgi:hypothetical protein
MGFSRTTVPTVSPICRPTELIEPAKTKYFSVRFCVAQSFKIGFNMELPNSDTMPNDAEDLDPDQVCTKSGESVEKLRNLMNEMTIVQEYENAINTGEDQPS